ncbi:MAG: hemerythrin domain-containing protein [Deltaproteobacteria bacterium]
MIPIGPLMREHRLIERLIEQMTSREKTFRADGIVDPLFVETVADFFRMYADRCHHGKEEDILFRDLARRKLDPAHAEIMKELVEEHKLGRRLVGQLVDAKERYGKGDDAAFSEILDTLRELADFYPKHIFKEDKQFFYPCMEYFSSKEKDEMLEEFWKFDRQLVHERYERIVNELEK